MSEEGFHEIQLNGKQLVFLFITVTVVSVVIFLCGVLVGRGVRVQLPETTADASVAPVPASASGSLEPSAQATPSTQAAATTDPATAAPPTPADDDLSYAKRLEGENQPKEKLKPQPAPERTQPPAPQATATQGKATARAETSVDIKPAPAPAAQTAPQASDRPQPAASEAKSDGFAVQVTALRDRGEADGIVKRLKGKGFPAYVIEPPAGGAVAVYRVRVGKYKNRREAEDIAARLEKEEQFRTWILR